MATRTKRTQQTQPRRPERKFGPFTNGIGLAVWLNSVETEQGQKHTTCLCNSSEPAAACRTGARNSTARIETGRDRWGFKSRCPDFVWQMISCGSS